MQLDNRPAILRERGFKSHPFEYWSAEDELFDNNWNNINIHLEGYFISATPLISDVVYRLNRNAIVFADAGTGKTTIEQQLQINRDAAHIMVVSVGCADFNNILDSLTIGCNGEIIKKAYIKKILELGYDKLSKELGRTINPEEGGFPAFYEVLKYYGSKYKHICVVIDVASDLSQISWMQGKTEGNQHILMQELLIPLLSLIKDWYHRTKVGERITFKLFLPLLPDWLRGNIYHELDLITKEKLQWNETKLQELLSRRLSYFSDGVIISLDTLMQGEAGVDSLAIEASLYVPRNLIRFCHRLFNQAEGYNLTSQNVNQALYIYAKERYDGKTIKGRDNLERIIDILKKRSTKIQNKRSKNKQLYDNYLELIQQMERDLDLLVHLPLKPPILM